MEPAMSCVNILNFHLHTRGEHLGRLTVPSVAICEPIIESIVLSDSSTLATNWLVLNNEQKHKLNLHYPKYLLHLQQQVHCL